MSCSGNNNLSGNGFLNLNWDRIYRAYYNRWRAICKVCGVHAEDEIKEFIHQSVTKALAKAESSQFTYQTDEKTYQYIARAIRNNIVNDSKRKRPEPLEPDMILLADELSQLEEIIKQEERKRVKEASGQLKGYKKEVIELRFYQGLKFHEIAKKTGWTISLVQKRLNAAIKEIEKIIAPRRV